MQNLDHRKTWPIFITFVLIIFLIIGYFCWDDCLAELYNKLVGFTSRSIEETSVKTNISKKNEILLNIENKGYIYNLDTGTMKPQDDFYDTIKNFQGAPQLVKNDKIEDSIIQIFYSRDRSKVILRVATMDMVRSSQGNGGYSVENSSQPEYTCDFVLKSCKETDIFYSPNKLLKEIHEWTIWDSQKNIFYDNYSKYYINTGKIQSLSSGLSSLYSLSPSFNKIALVGDYYKNEIKIYKNNDFSNLKYPIFTNKSGEAINSIAWSPDEKMIAVGTKTGIYTINLSNKEIKNRFVDETPNNNQVSWQNIEDYTYRNYWSGFQFSPDGKYIIFIDFVGDVKMLKKIDLSNNKITEMYESKASSMYFEQ